MQVTNLSYFYERSKKVRGGKWVWVKDSNGEQRGNVLLGGTILNPKKGFDHLWAGQLVEYIPSVGCYIFRSFKVESGVSNKKFNIKADGYSDVPEVGMYLMIAPESLEVKTTTATEEGGEITIEESFETYTGAYGKVTDVEFDATNNVFTVTLDAAISDGSIPSSVIIVEADAADDVELGVSATGVCEVLVQCPNSFIEADRDLMPTEGYGISGTANYSLSPVYNKQAWIERMQPLPEYVRANNRSLIEGIFWI